MASDSISVGANPGATFPNTHLTMHLPSKGGAPSLVGVKDGGAAWSRPEPTNTTALKLLQDAVTEENWAQIFSESKTKIQAEAKWSATPDRCAALQCLCTMHQSEHILEIGSFCGAAALAMAEAISKSGKVVALELEQYFVEFGAKFRAKSKAGIKVDTKVGPAVESLKDLVAEITDGDRKPFDFVVIDGDKATMVEYLKYVRSPYFLTNNALICMDVTPFKGQAPVRYQKFGAEEQWKTESGEDKIAALRSTIADLTDYVTHEFGGLLVMQLRPQEALVAMGEASPANRDDSDEDLEGSPANRDDSDED